ncbi:MAG: folylpolyglutamate synthase/dihydrofolate synthase family protein [Eubacteriales bacterium]|nr:folylpolyglutamate synthase/dihydrofolate synthase family protein [Eubacteriales bacterium]
MEYKEALDYMELVGKRGSIFGLRPIQILLEKLGNPQNQLRVIHIAGTNGKGSICSFLEMMYRVEEKRVGRYISPTLHGYLERFQINGEWMSEETFARMLSTVAPIIEEMRTLGEDIPTAFEIETVIAFLYFVEEHVDLVILETGMGGRLDATNVLQKPLCTVFASIGRDHMQFLGEDVVQIAQEKAGIMRDTCPVIAYPNDERVSRVLSECASSHHSVFLQVDQKDIEILSETLDGSCFRYLGEEYEISLAGTYQIYNAVTAIACKLLLDQTIKKDALKQVKWEGRFQVVSRSPLWVKDGAHNVDGVKALVNCVEKHFTNYKIIFIIGVLRDKEYEKMMRILGPIAECVYTITPDSPRALSAAELKQAIIPFCNQVTSCESLMQACIYANQQYEYFKQKQENAVVIACGSLSYIGQIEEILAMSE